MADLSPIHPGEILSEEFLKPLEVSAYWLAQATGLVQTRLSQIIHGKRSITPDTALRWAKHLAPRLIGFEKVLSVKVSGGPSPQGPPRSVPSPRKGGLRGLSPPYVKTF